MNRRRLCFWIIGASALVAVLILVSLIVLAQVIDRPGPRRWISAEVSARLGGEVGFEQIRLDWLPRPQVVLQNLHLQLPAGVDGQIKTLNLIPAWTALVRGRIQIAALTLVHPRIRLSLQPMATPEASPAGRFSIAKIGRSAAAGVGLLIRLAPELRLAVKDGELNLNTASERGFRLSQIQAHLVTSSRQITFDLDGRSELTETLHLQMRLNPNRLDGQGRLELTRLDTGRLMRLFQADSHPLDVEAFPELLIAFRTERFEDFSADVSAAAGRIDLRWQDRQAQLRCKELSGSLHLAKDSSEWVLKALELEDPALKLAGRLSVASSLASAEPRLRLTLDAREVDLTAVRHHALALSGDRPAIQHLANIVRQGRLERVTLTSSGGDLAEVMHLQNVQVRGTASDGVVRVPGLAAPIEHLQGEITIQEGLLKGEMLEADLGPSKARQGVFLLALSGKPRRLELDTDLNLDLDHALTLLRPLVKNRRLAAALDPIRTLEGRAQGRLRLGDRLDKLKFQVNVSDIQMTLRDRRLPYPLEILTGKLDYQGTRLRVKQVAGRFKGSSFSGVAGNLDWAGPLTFSASLASGVVDLALEVFYDWARAENQLAEKLRRVQAISGRLRLTELRLKGPAAVPEKWQYRAKGSLQKVGLSVSDLASPLSVADGRFDIDESAISFTFKGFTFLDTVLNGSGALNDYRQGIDRLKLAVNGSFGSGTHAWLSELYHLPHLVKLGKTLDISSAEIVWHRQGKTSFAADLSVEAEGRLTLSGSLLGRDLQVEKFLYEDRYSQFSATLSTGARDYDIAFDGFLDGRTIALISLENPVQVARMEGDFRLHVSLENFLLSRFDGRLGLEELAIDWLDPSPLICHRLTAKGSRGRLEFESVDLSWEENRARLEGYLLFSADDAVVDLTISSKAIDLDRILNRLADRDQAQRPGKKIELRPTYPVHGIVRLQLEQFTVQGRTWKPMVAAVAINQDRADMHVTRANLCGISTPAQLTLDPSGLKLNIRPRADDLSIQETNDCLWKRDIRINGAFDLAGEVGGQSAGPGLLSSLAGDLEFSARKGRIYRMNTLAKILAFLNVTEIFAGKLPDLNKEGFGYNTIELKVHIDQGKFYIQEGLLDGRSMTLTLQGSIDPAGQKIDLTILVAPFKTIDRIIQKIPLVNYILAGSLVSIPLKVEGDLKDPRVVPLAPTAVGEGLLGIMKRTLKAPFKLIQP